MNKFEHVSSDDHQMSVRKRVGPPGLMSREGGRSPGLMGRGTLPCDLSHNACDVPTYCPSYHKWQSVILVN